VLGFAFLVAQPIVTAAPAHRPAHVAAAAAGRSAADRGSQLGWRPDRGLNSLHHLPASGSIGS